MVAQMNRRQHSQAHRWQDRLQSLAPDAGIVIPALLLLTIGVVMVGSSSVAIAEKHAQPTFYYLIKHLVFLAGGFCLIAICWKLPIKWLETSSRMLLLLMVLALLLPLLPFLGVKINGAHRWINLGVSNFQTVEAVKLMLVIYLAGYLQQRAGQLNQRFFDTIKPLACAGLLGGILLLQPDMGSAMVLGAITVCMLFLAGAAWRYLLLLASVALPLIGLAATVDYRMERITGFLDPWSDPNNSGYQLIQALIAIGRGEVFGVGTGASVQKLFYLPEAHTDFIFAVLAEEFGLLGITALMLVYAWLIGRIMQIGARAHKMGRGFAGYLCWGMGVWLAMQALISMGVNLGVLPTKGLTLPLISSGGSSLLVCCAALGLVLRVKLELDREQLARPNVRRSWSADWSRDCSTESVR